MRFSIVAIYLPTAVINVEDFYEENFILRQAFICMLHVILKSNICSMIIRISVDLLVTIPKDSEIAELGKTVTITMQQTKSVPRNLKPKRPQYFIKRFFAVKIRPVDDFYIVRGMTPAPCISITINTQLSEKSHGMHCRFKPDKYGHQVVPSKPSPLIFAILLDFSIFYILIKLLNRN